MRELRNANGDLIAVIHDEAGFNALLDEFEMYLGELHLFDFRPLRKATGHYQLGFDHHTMASARIALECLKQIRQQLGDDRAGLYQFGYNKEPGNEG